MPKVHTFPTLFDEALQINITKLKNWGYLEKNICKRGTLTWSCRGRKTGSIDILVNTQAEPPYLEVDYKYREQPRKYKIDLISKPSNLGIGKLWFFVCPQTNKHCRKLYSVGGYFLHREAFKGCMYESQTHSKQYRELEKQFGAYFRIDKIYEEIYSKHFKKYYAGKPTKRYKKLLAQLEEAEKVDWRALEKMY